MKNSSIGLLLAWQFFSVLPIKRQLPMTKVTVTWMFSLLPVIGLCMGAVCAAIYEALQWADVTPLFTAILLVMAMIALTGGLHLDGWVDMSDAYFSYGDKEKRVAILDDPRIGAFGAMSLVCLLLLKIGALYEVLMQQAELLPFLLCIPFLSRIAIQLFFSATPLSKQTGLGAYFKSHVVRNKLLTLVGIYCVALVGIASYFALWSLVVLLVAVGLGVFFYKRWVLRNFGGMSGDLMGALCEGMEVVLWIIVLFCI
ncbi:MAG: adenosylcobinamide-GDP ribazoletransferase [Solibacillus sp.]